MCNIDSNPLRQAKISGLSSRILVWAACQKEDFNPAYNHICSHKRIWSDPEVILFSLKLSKAQPTIRFPYRWHKCDCLDRTLNLGRLSDLLPLLLCRSLLLTSVSSIANLRPASCEKTYLKCIQPSFYACIASVSVPKFLHKSCSQLATSWSGVAKITALYRLLVDTATRGGRPTSRTRSVRITK